MDYELRYTLMMEWKKVICIRKAEIDVSAAGFVGCAIADDHS